MLVLIQANMMRAFLPRERRGEEFRFRFMERCCAALEEAVHEATKNYGINNEKTAFLQHELACQYLDAGLTEKTVVLSSPDYRSKVEQCVARLDVT